MVDQLVTSRIDRDLLDATDALAAALCHHFQQKNLTGGGQNFKGWDAFLEGQSRSPGLEYTLLLSTYSTLL